MTLRIRDSLSLDEVIAAAEAVPDPTPERMAELAHRHSEGLISGRTYVVALTGLGLALLAMEEAYADPA
jgi:hypothetical protein